MSASGSQRSKAGTASLQENAIELGLLLIAVGFVQIWLIFHVLKSFWK